MGDRVLRHEYDHIGIREIRTHIPRRRVIKLLRTDMIDLGSLNAFCEMLIPEFLSCINNQDMGRRI